MKKNREKEKEEKRKRMRSSLVGWGLGLGLGLGLGREKGSTTKINKLFEDRIRNVNGFAVVMGFDDGIVFSVGPV